MTMDAMNEYLRDHGFEVRRSHEPTNREYIFSIEKDGIGCVLNFKYAGVASQKKFLDDIMKMWVDAKKQYESKSSSPNKRDVYNQLCNDTREDPNSLLYVNGNRYNVLIDTVGLDTSDIYGKSKLEVRCVVNSPGYINGANIDRIYKEGVNSAYGGYIFKNGSYITPITKIEKVIFNGPATIVLWSDGTKTVVKCQKDDMCDYEKGLAMAITKKALGNQGNYCNELKKWTQPAPPSYKSAMDEAMEENRRCAYNRLLNALHDKKATKVDLIHAMRDAARYLEYTLKD